MRTEASGSAHNQPKRQINRPATIAWALPRASVQDVQPGTAQVQRAVAVAPEDPEAQPVDDEAAHRHGQHERSAHRLRSLEALPRLQQDEDGDDDQGGTVDQCRQDLGTVVTEGPLGRGRLARHVDGEERQAERRGVPRACGRRRPAAPASWTIRPPTTSATR